MNKVGNRYHIKIDMNKLQKTDNLINRFWQQETKRQAWIHLSLRGKVTQLNFLCSSSVHEGESEEGAKSMWKWKRNKWDIIRTPFWGHEWLYVSECTRCSNTQCLDTWAWYYLNSFLSLFLLKISDITSGTNQNRHETPVRKSKWIFIIWSLITWILFPIGQYLAENSFPLSRELANFIQT